jgi:hypothetical protein
MKELVDEVVEKIQLEVLNLSPEERQAILQSLYRIVWELKTHEIIGKGRGKLIRSVYICILISKK